MDSPEKFCQKSNDFQQNINKASGFLREDIDFSDVILVCKDDQYIEAQHVILAASSPFFAVEEQTCTSTDLTNTLFQGSNLAISFPQRLSCLT